MILSINIYMKVEALR